MGESVPCASYDSWMVYIPEGEFLSRIGPTEFLKVSSFDLIFFWLVMLVQMGKELHYVNKSQWIHKILSEIVFILDFFGGFA